MAQSFIETKSERIELNGVTYNCTPSVLIFFENFINANEAINYLEVAALPAPVDPPAPVE